MHAREKTWLYKVVVGTCTVQEGGNPGEKRYGTACELDTQGRQQTA